MLPDPVAGPLGSDGNPIELEGITVTVSRWGWLVPWLVVGAAAWALLEASERGGRGGGVRRW